MNEIWMVIPGLLLFACFIWWITSGTSFLSRLARSSSEPASPAMKAAWWIAYAATAVWVLANSSCEDSAELGRYQERQPGQHTQEPDAGRGEGDQTHRRRPAVPDGARQKGRPA